MGVEQIVKDFAGRTPLRPIREYFSKRRRLRRLTQQFKEWSSEDQQRLSFYQQFISPGDLVFDVGANVGNRAKIFSKLGAVVVAVEPQVACADFLETAFADRANFHLVRKALGASVGQAEMLISPLDTISTLSSEWVRSVKESGRFADCRWDKKQTVSVDTLDNLIAEYGRPAFIKIDVEGFEEQVVAGLSTPVGAISMEFAPEFLRSTMECVRKLDRIGPVRFQISLGESMEFSLPDWVDAEEIEQALLAVAPTDFGDLYASFDTAEH